MRPVSSLAAAAIVLALVGAPMAAAQNASQNAAQSAAPERTVTIGGTGHVTAEPDTVHITLGVTSEAETAKAALEANTKSMKSIVDALKARKIEPKDIQTSNFSVNPRYRQGKSADTPAISGYQVQNSVRIVLRDVTALGGVLDQVIQLGANQVYGIAFEASKADALKDDARKAAVAHARHKAEIYAAAAGAKVGRVLDIVEVGTQAPRPQRFAARASSFSGDGAPPPVESGSLRLEAHVTITFALE